MSSQKKSEPAEPLSFESALERLESIVRELEEGQLGLEASLSSYEEGVGCLKQCYAALGRAERKVELLARVDEQGRAETEPFEEAEMSLEEKAESRSRRRSQGRKPTARRSGESEADVDAPRDLF